MYAYSVFHPFFEQYLTTARDTTFVLLLSVVAVVTIAVPFTGSVALAAILALCLASLLLDMLGCMVLLGVQLNAVSMVNLAMGVGISLEFVVHLAQGFLLEQGSRCGTAARWVLPFCSSLPDLFVRCWACTRLSVVCAHARQ